MSNDNNYIICTTIVAMLALVSVLIGVIVRSNSSEPKETAEEAAIIQQFELEFLRSNKKRHYLIQIMPMPSINLCRK